VKRARVLFVALCTAAGLFVGVPHSDAAVLGLPVGFHERIIASNFTLPTSFATAPDGRIFVVQKTGQLKVVPKGALTSKLVLDFSDHVNTYVDRGVLGVALDRDFASNGYVYMYYVYEHDSAHPTGVKTARLVRVKVGTDNKVANSIAPETVILGSLTPLPNATDACPVTGNRADCIPSDSYSHNGGAIRVASDATLWLAIGDANVDRKEDILYRPYDETSFAGKIVHIDRNGNGLAGHPFCPATTDLSFTCSKIYAKGFRNPFRITLRASGKGPVVGDVGDGRKEEIDLTKTGGNYGWPCYEGDEHYVNLQYRQRCLTEYEKEGTASADLMPVYAYARPAAGEGAAVMAGPTYTGTLYPAPYNQGIYFGDYVQGWLKRLVVDANDNFVSVDTFASAGWDGVDLQMLPSGELAYLLLAPHTLNAITYSATNAPPIASATSDVTYGPLPLTVQFNGSGSSDPDNDAMAFDWNFGDGSAHSTAVSPTHTYTGAGRFTVTLRVTDSNGAIAQAQLSIFPGDTPPVVQLTTPANNSLYRDGVTVDLSGSANDPEDGRLTGGSLTWDVLLHHNTHVHPFSLPSGENSSFSPLTDHDSDSYYTITLVATDSVGLSASKTINIYPETVQLTLASDPPGIVLSYGGQSYTAPVTRASAIGYQTSLGAPATVVLSGTTFTFIGWSDGGAQTHSITVPATNVTYTARYSSNDVTPPETTITSGPSQATTAKTATFKFVASEPVRYFLCRVDDNAWFQCSSPTTVTVARGTHTFKVKAVDISGNVDPTPDQYRWIA
jgi:glucose/arabinose dehydrogenase